MKGIVVAAELPVRSGYIMAKRVYDPTGISPTVTAIAGGGQAINIAVREWTA